MIQQNLDDNVKEARFSIWKHWDTYLSSVLWAYHNTQHSSTGEKPLHLLVGLDYCHHTEVDTLPTKSLNATEVTNYRKELVLKEHSKTKESSTINTLALISSEWQIGY